MPNTAIKNIELSPSALQHLEAAAPALVINLVKNLAPKFMGLADEVMGMATEVNSYVETYECVDFKVNKQVDEEDLDAFGYYKNVTFLVDVEDGEVVPFDRMSLNTHVRDIFFQVEINLRDSEKGISLEDLVGSPVEPDISTLNPLERFQSVSHFVSENLDTIADRIESGILDAEKIGLAAGGRKRVVINSPEELLPAVAQFYFEGGNGAVSLENFFDGGWCITGVIAVLDIFFHGKQVHG